MAIDNEVLIREDIDAETRRYTFEVKTSIDKVNYLMITEVQHGKVKGRIMIFEEHIRNFNDGFVKTLEVIGISNKKYSVAKIRKQFPRAYHKWTSQEEDILTKSFNAGIKNADIGKILERQPRAIRTRLQKLGLL